MHEERNENVTTSVDPVLEIRLFSTFQVKIRQEIVAGFRSDKTRALLAYLVTEGGSHRRDALTALLWSEFEDRAARRSLSSALANLRQLLAPAALPEVEALAIASDRSDVAFDIDPARVWVDVASFQRLIALSSTHAHRSLVHCQACIARLTQAVEIYRGDFLAGLSIPDSAAFDEWRVRQQEVFHVQVFDALGVLAQHHLTAGAYSQAEELARRQLSLTPWSEPAHRQLMAALAASGERAAALAQYEQCRLVLKKELHIEPEPLTVQMADQIRIGSTAFLESFGALEDGSPYKGLMPFQVADAADFYGRTRHTYQLIAKVQQEALVALIGASGTGKTSLVQAGLIHHLQNDQPTASSPAALPAMKTKQPVTSWLVAEMRPGQQPFDALAGCLAPLLAVRRSGTQRGDRTEQVSPQELRDGVVALGQLIDELTTGQNGKALRLLLILDQFEELFTLCSDETLRSLFVDVLLSAVQAHEDTGRLTVLIVLRADFMGQMLSLPELASLIQNRTLVLGPMDRAELEQVIAWPAQALGVRFQEGLVPRVLGDVGSAPGRLPLLEFALTQLWNQRIEGQLTHEAYESAGGVTGSLARYAEEVYAELSPEDQLLAQRVFTAMVQPGQDTEDTRRPVDRAEFGEARWTLVQKLASTRLVVTNRDTRGRETAEIVHEALIRGWDRLRQWTEADQAFLLWQHRQRAAVTQWQQSGRDPGALLRGATLAEAEGWTATRADDIAPSILEFVEASRNQRNLELAAAAATQQRELEQAQALARAEHQRAETEIKSRKRLRWLALGLGLVSILALATTLFAFDQSRQTKRLAGMAIDAQATAEAERAGAEQQAKRALSRQLAAQALTYSTIQPDVSVLLDAEAFNLSDSSADRQDFLINLKISPLLETFLHGQKGPIYAIAVSPDGQRVATANDTGDVQFWNLETRQPWGNPIEGFGDIVRSLEFSPDGTVLAAGDDAGRLVFLDGAKQQTLGEPIAAHTGQILDVGFSQDGKAVRTVSGDSTSRLWNVASGEPQGEPLPLIGRVGMAVSPDLNLVASRRGVTITVQNTEDGELVGKPMKGHTESIQHMAFNRDGSRLASASFDKTAMVWDVAQGETLYRPLPNGNARLIVSSFSPDGSLLATAGTNGKVVLWDVATGQPIVAPLEGNSNWIRALAFTPDGNKLIVGSADGALILWDIARYRRFSGHKGIVRGLAYSRDGKLLASGSYDKTALVWDTTTGQPVTPPMTGHQNSVSDVDITPDGDVVATATIGGAVTFFDAKTGEPLFPQEAGHDAGLIAVRFSPDGSILASGGFGNEVRLWDVKTGKPLEPALEGHGDWVLGLAFSPDGKTLASGSADTTVRLWDVASRQPIGEPLEGHTNWVPAVAFSPDGKTLVTGSHDETIRFWDVATGQAIGEPLRGHKGPIWYVAFDPSDGGKTLVSADGTGAVLRWDVATRLPLGPPLYTDTETEGIALSPDGKTVAIGSFDNSGAINLWKLDTTEWTQRVCDIANRNLTSDEIERFMGDVPNLIDCVP